MEDGTQVKRDPRRSLPGIDRLAARLREKNPDLAPWAATAGARRAVEAARAALAAGEVGEIHLEVLVEDAARRAVRLSDPHPRRVVNATGVVLHTNLGRAVLAPGAVAAVVEAASHATDLELTLATGRRGQRVAAVAEKLALLSGAEAGLAVNNNAAALLLALDTLARGREVIVSRGELVEIGGSFRVPDVMERAGVRLVEVGTTNRTHLRDYEAAIGPDTALLLKVHRSNFEQMGFVTEVSLADLSQLGRARNLPVLEDLGSGTLVDLRDRGLPAEAFAPDRLRQGADVLCFSGDKLLGGPQAGLLLGRAEPIAAMARNPLCRALRLDKLSLAALDWTLRALLDGGAERLPTLAQLFVTSASLEPRARALAERLAALAGDALRVDVAETDAAVGGGSVPGFALPSFVVRLEPRAGGALALADGLRAAPVPVVARVREEALWIDVRTLLPDDEDAVASALQHALAARSSR